MTFRRNNALPAFGIDDNEDKNRALRPPPAEARG